MKNIKYKYKPEHDSINKLGLNKQTRIYRLKTEHCSLQHIFTEWVSETVLPVVVELPLVAVPHSRICQTEHVNLTHRSNCTRWSWGVSEDLTMYARIEV